MKRIDTLLIFVAITLSTSCWLWTQFIGSVSAHFYLLSAGLLVGVAYLSYNGRNHWKAVQQSRMTELEQVMSEYQLSDQAMTHTENQLSDLCPFHGIRPSTPRESGLRFHGDSATCSTFIRPGQSERSDARFLG